MILINSFVKLQVQNLLRDHRSGGGKYGKKYDSQFDSPDLYPATFQAWKWGAKTSKNVFSASPDQNHCLQPDVK